MEFRFHRRGTSRLGFFNSYVKPKNISIRFLKTSSGYRTEVTGDSELADDANRIAEALARGAREIGSRAPFALSRNVKRELIQDYEIEILRTGREEFEDIGVALFSGGYDVFQGHNDRTQLSTQKRIYLTGEKDCDSTEKLIKWAQNEHQSGEIREFTKNLEDELKRQRSVSD